MSAKARTKSFALSAINACALIIVTCCDRVVVFHIFDTTPGAGGEITIRIFNFSIFMCFTNLNTAKSKIGKVVRE